MPGLRNRNGNRNHVASRNTEGCGDLQTKNILVEEINRWLHPDAFEAKDKRMDDVLFNQSQEDVDSSDDEG